MFPVRETLAKGYKKKERKKKQNIKGSLKVPITESNGLSEQASKYNAAGHNSHSG